MDCEDLAFSQRFKKIFAECAVTPTADKTLPHVVFRLNALMSDPRVQAVFPRPLPQVVPLTDIFSLRQFASQPVVERFTPGREELPPISRCWPAFGAIRQASGRFECSESRWRLDVGGSPEVTADLVEETLQEELWD